MWTCCTQYLLFSLLLQIQRNLQEKLSSERSQRSKAEEDLNSLKESYERQIYEMGEKLKLQVTAQPLQGQPTTATRGQCNVRVSNYIQHLLVRWNLCLKYPFKQES